MTASRTEVFFHQRGQPECKLEAGSWGLDIRLDHSSLSIFPTSTTPELVACLRAALENLEREMGLNEDYSGSIKFKLPIPRD